VIGYGLDYAEQYRSLPYIGVLELLDEEPNQSESAIVPNAKKRSNSKSESHNNKATAAAAAAANNSTKETKIKKQKK
jgi:hypothetical protein